MRTNTKSTKEVVETRKLIKHVTTRPWYSLHINIPSSWSKRLNLSAGDIMVLRSKGNVITMERLD